MKRSPRDLRDRHGPRRAITRPRRGVTMLLVGISIVVLLGVMAFSIDFGRMYLYRAQVHVSADAAALAGADRLVHLEPSRVVDSAVAYGRLNLVEKHVPVIGSEDIVPGRWDFTTHTFTPTGSWTSPSTNAVQATARYTARYQFGRIFGRQTSLRSATSVAALGASGAVACVRPWAISYETLLLKLYPSGPPGIPYDSTYLLTPEDVSRLASATLADTIALKYDGTSAGSGSFGAVLPTPTLTADGVSHAPGSSSASTYAALLANCDPTIVIGVGDWLEQNSGNMVGPSRKGLGDLCGIAGNPQSFPCLPPRAIRMVIYSTYGGTASANGATKSCSPGCFQVKYLGVFAVTAWDKDRQAIGYFTSLASTGKFVPGSGPLRRIALVQ